MGMKASSSEAFYDSMADRYTEAIQRCVPRYDEMLSMLFAYLPRHLSPKRILELGCGSGNLTLQVADYFPSSEITVVDFSEEMLSICSDRLREKRFVVVKSDFKELVFPEESFDLVLSSIAIHHLRDEDKQVLFANIHRWLSKTGVLVFADQFRGAADFIYETHLRRWYEEARKKGVADGDWDEWMQHQSQHDFHAPLACHLDWLRNAGFRDVDCLWRYLLWAVIHAHK